MKTKKPNRRELLQNVGRSVALSAAAVTGIHSAVKASTPSQSRLRSLLKVDEDLILYEESEDPIQTGMKNPRKIALDRQDNIYIAGRQSIKRFSPSGQVQSFSIPTEQNITALYVTADNHFYVGLNNRIQVFDAKGQSQKQWEPVNGDAIISSIGSYGDDVFAADTGNRVIHHYKADGTYIKEFGEFVIPSLYFDIAVTGSDEIYAANCGKHRIECYRFNGNMKAWWGSFSMTDPEKFCGCCNPVSFAVLPDDQGFITSEKGFTRMKWYDTNGDLNGFVAGPQQFSRTQLNLERMDTFTSPYGIDIAVDSEGRVIALEPQKSEIRIFTKKTKA